MKIDIVTREEFSELKAMVQQVLDLLKNTNNDYNDWTDSEGMKKMLNCSDGTLSNYRNSGILPFANHGGKKYYNRKIVDDILRAKMIISDTANLN